MIRYENLLKIFGSRALGIEFLLKNRGEIRERLAIYSLVLNKRPTRLFFSKIFLIPPDLIWTPLLIDLGKILFQQLQNIQKYTVNKG